MARFDNVGLWWEDFPAERKANAAHDFIRRIEVPHTGWEPPSEFPNLSGVKVLGLDTETKDLELLERGPGSVRGAAHAVGISVSTDSKAWYFPIRHEYEPQKNLNLDPDKVFAWLSDQLRNTEFPVVGANLLYDLEVLRAEGVALGKHKWLDVQYAEPLLDESASSYSLDILARKHLKQGKVTPTLYDWCAKSFGGDANAKQRKNIWRSPLTLVGPYAEGDALLPVDILDIQRNRLSAENLDTLFDLECRLIPLLLDMRFRGVRIDEDKAQQMANWLREKAAEAQARIPHVDVWSNDSVSKAFEKEGLEYPLTEAGNPSFTKVFLESIAPVSPLAASVLDVRLYEKAANPFVESYLLGNLHNGRVHCQFHPLRSDSYGTVSGRFSSSNPNLQNIPSRHKVIGPMLRSLFIPEKGCRWKRADYSQVEFRLLAHHAIGPGSEELRERYRKDKNTDFHQLTIDMVNTITGILLDRTPAKNINFGNVYGMGKDKCIRSLGVSEELGLRFYNAYHEALPCVRHTAKSATRLGARRGYIKTILGRRRRFPNEESAHTALNNCLQGSSADIIKKAMVTCYEAGLFDVTGIPHLTVHDELDWSDDMSPEAEEAFNEVKYEMETCVPLRVPLRVDFSEGNNWAEAH